MVRNPYTLFVSHYQFRWWATHPPFSTDVLAEKFPNFPDLSIDEFVDFCTLRAAHEPLGARLADLGVGDLSRFFINLFYEEPAAVFQALDEDTISSGQLLDRMPSITFLRQERLVEELIRFLARHGYSERELQHVATRERANVTRGHGGNDATLLTPKVLSHVRDRERVLLALLAGVGIDYQAPS